MRTRLQRLQDFPPPPAGRVGWPWTGGVPATSVFDLTVSVVIPSFGQGQFVEETLRSVLLQPLESLEVVVMDGGSQDNTVEILKKYAPFLTSFVSQKDSGQTAAINAGWKKCTGALITWLNADDTLLPNWAAAMTAVFGQRAAVDLACANAQVTNAQGAPLWLFCGGAPNVELLATRWLSPFPQPGFLMRQEVVSKFGPLNEQLHFAMDTEFWLRILTGGATPTYVPETVATFRMHEATKTSTQQGRAFSDLLHITQAFAQTAPPAWRDTAARAMALRYWNAAHSALSAGMGAATRSFALQHWRQSGLVATPQVAVMLALSLLGSRSSLVLGQMRKVRAALRSVSALTIT